MSMTVIVLIVAAVVILLLFIGGGIIFFVVRKGKSKASALPAPQEGYPVAASAPERAPANAWSPPPSGPAESEAPAWGAAPAAPQPSPEPPAAEPAPAAFEPPVAEPPAWTPPAPPAPQPDPFPPVQPAIPSARPPVAADALAATLGPESYTTTPNVSAIPVSTVDPFATTPNVPVRPTGDVVPAMLRAHDGSVIQLVRVQMRVGRHPECEIVIPTPGTSRNHAEFQCVNGAWVINDLNSGNGTFVNGVRVRTHQLVSGDEVRVDQTKFWFTLGG